MYTTQHTNWLRSAWQAVVTLCPVVPASSYLCHCKHTYTSMFRLRELSSTIKMDFCKAQRSTHPKEACSHLFSYSMSRPDLLQRRSSNCLTCLHWLLQWQIFHLLLHSIFLCFILPINTIRIMTELIMGLCQESGWNNKLFYHTLKMHFPNLKKKKKKKQASMRVHNESCAFSRVCSRL